MRAPRPRSSATRFPGNRLPVNRRPAALIVRGRNDTDAADALSRLSTESTLADDTAGADRIAAGLVDRLAPGAEQATARGRLTQALAGIPGTTVTRALVELSHDADRAVALTAAYLLQLRATQ